MVASSAFSAPRCVFSGGLLFLQEAICLWLLGQPPFVGAALCAWCLTLCSQTPPGLVPGVFHRLEVTVVALPVDMCGAAGSLSAGWMMSAHRFVVLGDLSAPLSVAVGLFAVGEVADHVEHF